MRQWQLDMLYETAERAAADDWHIERCDVQQGLVIRWRPGLRRPETDYQAMILLGMLGTWHRSGLPRVRIDGERRLTQLIRSEPAQRPLPPWAGWLIILPREQRSVSIAGSDGAPDYVQAVLCICMDDLWSYIGIAHRTEFSELGRTAEYLRDCVRDSVQCYPDGMRMPIVAEDEHAWACMNRVVLNTTLALDDLEGVERKGAERGARTAGRYPAGDYVLCHHR